MKNTLIFSLLAIALLGFTPKNNASKTEDCGCNTAAMAWSYTTVIFNGKTAKVKCGNQFSLKVGRVIKLSGNYNCTADCRNKYVLKLQKADGTVLSEEGQPTADWLFEKVFDTPGNYQLTVTGVCNSKYCNACTFFFTVY